MRRFVHMQRSLSRLIILAMLAAALFPVLGHASGSAAPVWMEVCTADGVEVRAVSPDDPASPAPTLLVEHCPYCLVSSFDDQLHPPASGAFSPGEIAIAVPAAPLSFTVPFPSWPAALPRAPPAVL